MSPYSYDVGVEEFQEKVVDASRRVPVLVDFWAPWCGPCRALTPVLEKLAEEHKGRFLLAKVNSDDNQALAYQYGVRGIPSVKAFVGGELVDEFTGALPEVRVREFLSLILPSLAEPLRQQAAAAKAHGQTDTARALLTQAVEADARHEPSRLDLAELLIEAGDFDGARALLDELGDAARDAARADALRAQLELAAAAPADADEGGLARRVARDPADLEARLAFAHVLARQADYRAAMEQLIEIVRRDRGFQDDAGRRQLIQLFNLLAPDERYADLVRDYRSALAGLLNR